MSTKRHDQLVIKWPTAFFPETAAAFIAEALRIALSENQSVNLVLTGGRKIGAVYRNLSCVSDVDWQGVRFFWGDERCVSPDHPDSNYHMAAETLLKPLMISANMIFRMRGELDPPTAAEEYAAIVENELNGGKAVDLLLLGMGEDGHTASLFPGTKAVSEDKQAVVANYVPQLNSWRLTMTRPVLQKARQCFVMATGNEKKPVLNCVLAGQCTENEFPVSLLRGSSGKVAWLTDTER